MNRSENIEVKQSKSSVAFGYVAAFLMKLWSFTLRYQTNGKKGLHPPDLSDDSVIFTLWHNRIFTLPPVWKKTGGKKRSTVVLTSASRDGTTLATAMSVLGIGAVRGSSSRRAVSALIGMKKAIQNGQDVVITPDGPKGPRYQVQPGIIKMAQATGAKIVPLHATFSSAWRLKSWDRFVIPKPFSKVIITFDDGFLVPRKISGEDYEAARARLEATLLAGTDDV